MNREWELFSDEVPRSDRESESAIGVRRQHAEIGRERRGAQETMGVRRG